MAETIQLLIATVFLRPYVFVFLAFYLTAASVAIGWRRTALLTEIAWVAAFLAEYSSTGNGIPFGFYGYSLILTFNLVMIFTIGEMLPGITGIFLYIPITMMVSTRYRQWGAAHSVVGRGVLA